jgi:acetyl esterase/lipase/lysophospholipase L1-like esterase
MKRTLFLAALAMLSLGSLNAQRQVTISLSNDGKARLEGFLPAQGSGRAVVALPGGGYTHLAVNHEGYDWKDFFNERGIAYFVLTYRMPKGDRNIPLGDAQKAIRTVRDSAAAWGINPADVGIMGSSAGGHLASSVATHSPFESTPDFQILFYPVISMVEKETHQGSLVGFLGDNRNDNELVAEWSNMNKVNRQTSPAIILLSSDDGAVPPLTNGLPYYEALVRNEVPASFVSFPNGGHGWGYRDNFAYHNDVVNVLSSWLRTLPSARNDARLTGKKIAFIGDSYVYNHHDPREYTWMYRFARKYGMQYQCLGRNGTCIAMDRPGKPDEAIYKRYTQIADSTDYIVIVAGHNDSSRGRIDSIGSKEFTKQLTSMIKGMRERYPQAQILMFSPWRSVQADTPDNDAALASYKGSPREKVVKLEAKVCKKLGVPFFDAAADTTVQVWNPEFRKKYFQSPTDNAHLNRRGHGLFLPVAEKFILENIK